MRWLSCCRVYPVDFWCQNDVVSTSMRCNHVASTLLRYHFTSCARWVMSICLYICYFMRTLWKLSRTENILRQNDLKAIQNIHRTSTCFFITGKNAALWVLVLFRISLASFCSIKDIEGSAQDYANFLFFFFYFLKFTFCSFENLMVKNLFCDIIQSHAFLQKVLLFVI